MKRFVTRVALTAALVLVVSASAEANGKGNSGKSGSKGGSSGGSFKSSQASTFKGNVTGGMKSGSSKSQPHVNKGDFKKVPFDKGHVIKNWNGKFKNDHVHVKNYHSKHGHKFSHGWCFNGKHHSHWSCWNWNAHWGCYNYWCPSASCWYYWYEPHCCYYPVTYIQTCTPVAYASPQVVPVAATPLISIQNGAVSGGGVAVTNGPAAQVPGMLPPPQP